MEGEGGFQFRGQREFRMVLLGGDGDVVGEKMKNGACWYETSDSCGESERVVRFHVGFSDGTVWAADGDSSGT